MDIEHSIPVNAKNLGDIRLEFVEGMPPYPCSESNCWNNASGHLAIRIHGQEFLLPLCGIHSILFSHE